MEVMGLGPLPQGWEAKIEPKTGRIYFINHPSQSTTWTDPRLHGIPTPPYHIAITQPTAYFEDSSGSRRSPIPSLKALTLNRRGSSPRLGGSPRIAPSPVPAPRRSEQQIILEAEQKTLREPSAGQTRLRSASIGTELPYERPSSARSYSSTFSGSVLPSSYFSTCDPDTAFVTVCALFPTAPEAHIRHLFNKYHSRGALVVSALQVEKYPFDPEIASQLELKLTARDAESETVGDTKSVGLQSPFKTSFTAGSPARDIGTPVSMLKFSNNASSAGSTRWGSPLLSMSPQLQMVKEESLASTKSPKMKLKYLKGIFPAADETFLLDVLASCEDNVQKATQKLLQKGFTRTPPAKPARQKWLEVKLLIEKRNRALEEQKVVSEEHIANGEPVESPFPTPIMKPARPHLSVEDKENVKAILVTKFPQLPERFVSWASEAANYELAKATRLLQEIGPQTPEEFKPFVVSSPVTHVPKDEADRRIVRFVETQDRMPDLVSTTVMQGQQAWGMDVLDSAYYEPEGKGRKKSFITSLFGTRAGRGKEYIQSSKIAKGPNSSLVRGPNLGLLQPTHLAIKGPAALHKGPQTNNRVAVPGLARGPNPKLVKGSMWTNKKNSPSAARAFHH